MAPHDLMADAAHDVMDDAENASIARIVDALLAEHALTNDDDPRAKADQREPPRRSWMDQVGKRR
jgi:hypothetical protein